MKLFTLTVLILLSFGIFFKPGPASCQYSTLGLFENHSDIGTVRKPGSLSYDAEKQEYVIEGSGNNMWADHDEFHFVWKRMKGNFILTTKAQFIGKGVEEHRKIGWIVRSNLDSDSPHVNAAVHGDGLTSLQFRRTRGDPTEEIKSSLKGAEIIELERKGNTYRMSVARFGEEFITELVSDLTLGDEVYVGLYVCSHNKDVMEKAVFRNVRITVPVKDDYVPYRDYIGSNLEILDIESGGRRVIYRSPEAMQAPNWTPDGKALIYNSGGRLYRYDLAKEKAVALNTDFATSNNNDHVLSFDGKWMGISHHSKEDQNKSIVYVLPVKGGKPRRVTSRGPSYLHGWSPDGKFLIYTGERNGEFDIYKVSAEGGEETRLTTAKGLDDGSEYSPDGKYIYFNSNRTATMQIWRMKPDGSNQEQVTSDEYNNWFPHISPDGKWVILLSFSKEIDSGDHPFYKKVYLRLMPAGGGKPRIVAYLYGGQGTINVPSWSPDSKRVAFVSNTDMK
jgi:Tol biopolymer transport system component/regulation of enolase protein 1 (concanavalin A-like superfamily)